MHRHTMSACKTGEIWIKSMDCTNVNVLALILCSNDVRCYDWGKLVKGRGGLSVLFLSFPVGLYFHLQMKDLRLMEVTYLWKGKWRFYSIFLLWPHSCKLLSPPQALGVERELPEVGPCNPVILHSKWVWRVFFFFHLGSETVWLSQPIVGKPFSEGLNHALLLHFFTQPSSRLWLKEEWPQIPAL